MNDLPRLLSRLLPGEPVGVIHPDGAEGAVTADRITLIKKGRGPGAIVRLVDGAELPAALDYATLFRRLSASPNWFKPHIDHLVNLDRLERIGVATSDRYQLQLAGGAVAPLTRVYAPVLKSRLSLDSLDHVIPFNRPAYWMLEENLQDIEAPINKMEKPELLATFGASFKVSEIIGNFLWQFVNRIRKGVQPPLTGRNVRTLWYLIKPTLSKLGVIHGMDHYKTVSEKLADYVAKGMMRYREFGFSEEGNWAIGTRRPEVILVAEKRSYIDYLKLLRKSFGTSVIALGGKPKTITSEYFTDAFKAKVPGYWRKDRVLVIGLIDYDPSGWIIGRTFMDDLRVFGIKRARLVNLVIPSNFTSEEVEMYKYSLLDPEAGDDEAPPAGGYLTTVKAWMKEFGGVNGEPYGIESDSLMLDDDKVRRLIREVLGGVRGIGA